MAQAFFENYAPDDLRAESPGEEPADAIWPNVVEAMRAVGIDISPRSCPYVIGGIGGWDVDDPAGQSLEKVREISWSPITP